MVFLSLSDRYTLRRLNRTMKQLSEMKYHELQSLAREVFTEKDKQELIKLLTAVGYE